MLATQKQKKLRMLGAPRLVWRWGDLEKVGESSADFVAHRTVPKDQGTKGPGSKGLADQWTRGPTQDVCLLIRFLFFIVLLFLCLLILVLFSFDLDAVGTQ